MALIVEVDNEDDDDKKGDDDDDSNDTGDDDDVDNDNSFCLLFLIAEIGGQSSTGKECSLVGVMSSAADVNNDGILVFVVVVLLS